MRIVSWAVVLCTMVPTSAWADFSVTEDSPCIQINDILDAYLQGHEVTRGLADIIAQQTYYLLQLEDKKYVAEHRLAQPIMPTLNREYHAHLIADVFDECGDKPNELWKDSVASVFQKLIEGRAQGTSLRNY
jgi:hypothetical protein